MKIFAIVNQLYTNTYDTLYYEAKKNPNIEWCFVLIPFDYLTTHVTVEELIKLMKKKKYPYILGFDKGKYVDLKKYNPDLVFIQTPYDSAYGSKLYQTPYLKTFCAIATISYGCSMISFEGSYYKNWMDKIQNIKNLWKSFNETEITSKIINDCYPGRSVNVGYLKCDKYINYGENKDFSVKEKDNKFTIVWKPRWLATLGESNFLKYIYYFIYFCKKHSEINFIFLLHQNLEGFLNHRNIMKTGDFQKLLKDFKKLENAKVVMNDDFLDDVMNADLYIGDYSSTVVEFALTAKPIIYTPCDICLNKIGKKIYEASYICENIEQMENAILNIINGKDCKKNLRNELKEFLLIDTPKNQTYAQNLLNYIIEQEEEIKKFPSSNVNTSIKNADFSIKKIVFFKRLRTRIDLMYNALVLIFSCFPIFDRLIKREKILKKLAKYIKQ